MEMKWNAVDVEEFAVLYISGKAQYFIKFSAQAVLQARLAMQLRLVTAQTALRHRPPPLPAWGGSMKGSQRGAPLSHCS